MTSINIELALSYVKLSLSSLKIYMCNLMAWLNQQIVGTNCAPIIADLFLYSYEMDFMSNL